MSDGDRQREHRTCGDIDSPALLPSFVGGAGATEIQTPSILLLEQTGRALLLHATLAPSPSWRCLARGVKHCNTAPASSPLAARLVADWRRSGSN